ncbi:hypothetical protein M5X05_26865 [Paenibacillus alvei]|uniref:hypothetical protein n=1 Tax=Paenibacillus alvei TaxID=44250 RepID=UPI000287C96E|nr:hypothetical protein [Paenibacillus alvei]EJW14066.1 hypothetical protein PAV_141p01720 [Paenibacillus alvei DSM 29]MCY9707783.1 hypothetical protein [Paenibacillus alvei]
MTAIKTKPKVVSYKGFKIKEVGDEFHVFTKDEWAMPAAVRVVEWEAGTMQEAKDFIDSY